MYYTPILKVWCHAFYLSDKQANNHEGRFNLFGLISQQCTTYMSCGMAERMTTGSVVSALPYRATQVFCNVVLSHALKKYYCLYLLHNLLICS